MLRYFLLPCPIHYYYCSLLWKNEYVVHSEANTIWRYPVVNAAICFCIYAFVCTPLWKRTKTIQFDYRSGPHLDHWLNDHVWLPFRVFVRRILQAHTRARIRRWTIHNTSWNRIILSHCTHKHLRSVPNTQWSYKCTRIHPSVGRETYTLQQTITNRPCRKHLCFFFALSIQHRLTGRLYPRTSPSISSILCYLVTTWFSANFKNDF